MCVYVCVLCVYFFVYCVYAVASAILRGVGAVHVQWPLPHPGAVSGGTGASQRGPGLAGLHGAHRRRGSQKGQTTQVIFPSPSQPAGPLTPAGIHYHHDELKHTHSTFSFRFIIPLHVDLHYIHTTWTASRQTHSPQETD